MPNPNTLPSELSGKIEILMENHVETLILNSNDLSMAPYFQKSDSVHRAFPIFMESFRSSCIFENKPETFTSEKIALH